LLLGKSETTSGVPDLFSEVAKSDKIYSRKDVPSKFMQVVNRRSELDFNRKKKTKPAKEESRLSKKRQMRLCSKSTPLPV
jgi:two-component system, chemotaxis family, CheB/CheR fusion protein